MLHSQTLYLALATACWIMMGPAPSSAGDTDLLPLQPLGSCPKTMREPLYPPSGSFVGLVFEQASFGDCR